MAISKELHEIAITFNKSPNFPSFRQGRFTLEIRNLLAHGAIPSFLPLRSNASSGKTLPLWELECRTPCGSIAGGCAVTMPLGRGDFPSPRQVPHPVLGEWISALRITGHDWLECGAISVLPGFSKEIVIGLLWEGLLRLVRRNGITFLVGVAPTESLVMDIVLKRGARVLEPCGSGPAPRYFLYVDP